MHSDVVIRHAQSTDDEFIAKIYAVEVLTGLASFETEPPTASEIAQRRKNLLEAGYPYLVATIDKAVVGFAYAGPYRARPAYQNSVENSVYIDANIRKRGVGILLLTNLIQACEEGPWRQMIAVIGNSANAGSVALHGKAGFRMVGTIEAVGYKHDQWVDTVIMQRALGEGASTVPATR